MEFPSFFAVMFITALILLIVGQLAADRFMRHHMAQKADFFRHFPVEPGDIVFLGDSLTDGARWDELFPAWPVKNRGINSDTTVGVLNRLDVILTGQPAAIFLLIGTNDLPWYGIHRSDIAILKTYTAILVRIQAASPATKVFVQSIFPRAAHYNARIRALNARLAGLAERHNCTFVDVFPVLVGPDGGLRKELNNDHLHLLGPGYEAWVKVLQPYLDSLKK